MSSLAIPRDAAPTRGARRSLVDTFSLRGSDVLLAVAVLGVAFVLLANLPSSFDVDTWLELVAGRDLWQNGIPHHETLTLIAHGKPWVDQQWLAQLGSYGLYRVGGLGLLGLVDVGLIVSSVAGAVLGARRLGADPRVAMVALAFAMFMTLPARQVRTQEFAMPLFVGLAYLLASDSRRPSRRVFWCLPMLVLWANLHGTVTLGVALVVLRAGTLAWDRRAQLRRSARAWRRPLALAAGAVIAPLLTPYGLQIIDYYRATMLGSALKHTVSEWQPITFSPGTAAVFFLAAGIAIWSFGRDARRTTTWERIALLLLMAGAIDVIRNSLFFGLLGLIVVPVSLSGVAAARTPRADRLRGSVNLALSAAALIAVLVAGVSTLVHSPDRLEFHSQRPGVLSAVSRITRADPAIRVLAEDRFTDWLMWRDPALEGRLANDVRYELLTESQLDALNRVFGVIGPDWKNAARGYRLLVLNRRFVPAAVTAFTAEPGSRVAYDDGERVVILRSVKAAR